MAEFSGISAGERTEKDLVRDVGLWTLLKEDFRTHGRKWTSAGLQALWVHRIGVYAETCRRPMRMLLKPLYTLGHLFCRNFYGVELERTVQMGRRNQIGHQHGIVIHKWARIGDDCIFRQGVTLGSGVEWTHKEGPVVGNGVSFGVGCVIVGNVTIGDNVSIGPNCVVMTDIPSDRTVFTPPPRVLPKKTDTPPPAAGA
ncbi:MAG: serine acetyltransferase [Pseudomonadota bacterium]